MSHREHTCMSLKYLVVRRRWCARAIFNVQSLYPINVCRRQRVNSLRQQTLWIIRHELNGVVAKGKRNHIIFLFIIILVPIVTHTCKCRTELERLCIRALCTKNRIRFVPLTATRASCSLPFSLSWPGLLAQSKLLKQTKYASEVSSMAEEHNSVAMPKSFIERKCLEGRHSCFRHIGISIYTHSYMYIIIIDETRNGYRHCEMLGWTLTIWKMMAQKERSQQSEYRTHENNVACALAREMATISGGTEAEWRKKNVNERWAYKNVKSITHDMQVFSGLCINGCQQLCASSFGVNVRANYDDIHRRDGVAVYCRPASKNYSSRDFCL